MEGVRRSQYDTLVKSVFHSKRFATDDLIEALALKFQDRTLEEGRAPNPSRRGRPFGGPAAGTDSAPLPGDLGDRGSVIISDVPGSIRAAERMIKVRQVVIPRCGHAPQIEKSRLVNSLVLRFLRDKLRTIPPRSTPIGSWPTMAGTVLRPTATASSKAVDR